MTDLPPISEAAAKALAEGPYARVLLENLARYAAPIGWVIGTDAGGQKLRHGTAFFVQTDQALFGVTADHVVEDFLRTQAAGRTICHLLDQPLDLAASIISRGRTTDIATFKVESKLLAKIAKQPTTVWPPVVPAAGSGMMYAGFPGVERLRTGTQEHSFGIYCATNLVQRVDDDLIVAQPMRRDEVKDAFGLGLPSDDYDLGGMSGGPVLAMVSRGALMSWVVCGVISQGLSFGHVFYAARADCIQADGQITR